MRHSGYFLYQAEYSEYYFTKTLWPDFTEDELDAAITGFAGAQRNFGK
jgi:undecaprenyl diphosphate synthase